jgi:hypothetical protein
MIPDLLDSFPLVEVVCNPRLYLRLAFVWIIVTFLSNIITIFIVITYLFRPLNPLVLYTLCSISIAPTLHYSCPRSWHSVAAQMAASWLLCSLGMPTLMHPSSLYLPMCPSTVPKCASMLSIPAPIWAYLGRGHRQSCGSSPSCAWIGLRPHSSWCIVAMRQFRQLALSSMPLIAVPRCLSSNSQLLAQYRCSYCLGCPHCHCHCHCLNWPLNHWIPRLHLRLGLCALPHPAGLHLLLNTALASHQTTTAIALP